MPNNIAFARNYTAVIDEVYQRVSVSSVLNKRLPRRRGPRATLPW